MNCTLCEKIIKNYQIKFNHLIINDSHEIDICQECVEKFRKWQQWILADLFPTKLAKKRYEKK